MKAKRIHTDSEKCSGEAEQPRLELIKQPHDFFREMVMGAAQKRKIRLELELEFYLVKLLSQFITVDRLFAPDPDGGRRTPTLAFMVQEALDAQTRDEQARVFRNLGDVSLYTAGYFQDSFERKLVDVDYYISMGRAAYRQVANRLDQSVDRALFEGLSSGFSGLVDILADVSDQTTPKTEKNLLRIYEVWMRTGSDRAAKQLQEAGIIPQEDWPEDLQ